MTYKKNGLKFKITAVCLVLCTVITCLTACGLPKGVRAVKVSAITQKDADYSAEKNHVSDPENLVFVAKSGLLELYFDNVTYSVAVKDSSTDKFWYSLPEKSGDDSACTASVLSVAVSKDAAVYYLNSQDNAVAFDSASFRPITNGIQITYDMALKKEVADKGYNNLSADDLYVSVTAVYTVVDGAFYSKISCANMLVSSGYTVEKISFMNYFGASAQAQEGDFLFVPDASGAIIKTDVEQKDNVKEYGFDVYGPNSALGESKTPSALFGCFGIKSGENAFAAILLSGDTVASIGARRHGTAGTYNRVGASFEITECRYSEEKGTKYFGMRFNGDINICYRFLSGRNAGYVGMASACREVLIRNGVLSTQTLEPSEHIPFMLTVQGAVSKANAHSYIKLSTYEQTLELLGLMKAKSINSINLRYCGILSGADTQDILSKASLIGALGGKKSFEELSNYVKTQKFNMYLDLSINSFNKKSASVSSKAAEMIDSQNNSLKTDNGYLEVTAGKKSQSFKLSVTEIADSILNFLGKFRDYPFDGYCINDAGRMLYSDYSDETYSRDSVAAAFSEQAAVLSNDRKIMIEKGYFYMLSNADAVVDIPVNTAYPQNDGYVQIPFVEMVLHGIVNYSLEPINLQSNKQYALLKSIEYGAMPSYEWVCTKVKNDAFNSKYHYENQLATAAEYYKTADDVLGDLSDARLTSHYEVQPGVYCSEYNNSTIIYFNYNSQPVTVNSITIPEMSCLRAN